MDAANMLGVDVAGLDVAAFLSGSRRLFPVLAVLGLVALLRVQRAALLLGGVLAANAFVWGVSQYPLQRIYALGPSHDRINNLGLCQVVAAGNSPLQTVQVGQLHFEPFWGLFVATLSGWDPDRVLRLYPFLPLLMVLAFVFALEYGLRPLQGQGGWSGWERALAAGFATLLSSSPLDFTGTYRVPWAMTFLLKPNHALGLVLLPLVLRAFASIRGWKGRIAAGAFLHLLGWVFVLHMAYVCFGLLVFAAWSFLARDRGAWRDAKDVLGVIGINLLVISPYLYMLAVGYPLLDPSPRMMVPPSSAQVLEPTLRTGWIFPLTVWGLVQVQRQRERFGRIWVAQVIGALVLWVSYLVLSLLQIAREKDELYYWLRFLLALFAAFGAWDLARRVARRLSPTGLSETSRAVTVCLLTLASSLPLWWDPFRMDLYFAGSLPPLDAAVRAPTDFLRQKTEPAAVVVTDPEFARYVAALGARRVLRSAGMHMTKDEDDRVRLEERLVRGGSADDLRTASSRYGVQFLVATPRLLAAHRGATLQVIEAHPSLERVFFEGDAASDFVAIFRLKAPFR